MGTNKDVIVKETAELLENVNKYKEMADLHNPYGDGKASQRIVQYIKYL